MQMTKKLLSFLLLSCFLFVSACDSNDDGGNGGDDDDDNTASVEVSGPISGTYPGFATFVSVAGISHAITIILDNDEGTAILTAFGVKMAVDGCIGRDQSDVREQRTGEDDPEDG